MASLYQRNYDDALSKYRLQIHDRDQYTCQLCGFQSTVYMDVLNKDGIYSHNQRDNLVTACPFCVQCHFMEMVKAGYGGGILIYLPEITQIELTGSCHALFCAMANTTEYADESEGIYNSLRLRQKSSSVNTVRVYLNRGCWAKCCRYPHAESRTNHRWVILKRPSLAATVK